MATGCSVYQTFFLPPHKEKSGVTMWDYTMFKWVIAKGRLILKKNIFKNFEIPIYFLNKILNFQNINLNGVFWNILTRLNCWVLSITCYHTSNSSTFMYTMFNISSPHIYSISTTFITFKNYFLICLKLSRVCLPLDIVPFWLHHKTHSVRVRVRFNSGNQP